MSGIYHWRDNWFFKRGADGTVVIRHTATETRRPDVELFIPPNEWASIIASVSAMGETSEQYQAATLFHAGPTAAAGTVPLLEGDTLETLRARMDAAEVNDGE